MLAEHLGELAGELRAEALEPLVVGLGELDVEVVGHQPPVAAEDLRGVVDLAVERRGDLDRLHGAAEGAREDPGDHLLEPVLEALQPLMVPPLAASGASASAVRAFWRWYRAPGPARVPVWAPETDVG